MIIEGGERLRRGSIFIGAANNFRLPARLAERRASVSVRSRRLGRE